MSEQKSATEQPPEGGEGILAHLGAILAGVILMIVGLAMGVTVVMLPLGIAVGLGGLLVLLWGIFGTGR
jgi:hypothetical protein